MATLLVRNSKRVVSEGSRVFRVSTPSTPVSLPVRPVMMVARVGLHTGPARPGRR